MSTEAACASSAPTRRATCALCARPLRACLCAWVAPVVHTTEVLILQHPLEVRQAKNTARLLHLSLVHSRLVVGEVFDPDAIASPRRTLLLYPPDPEPSRGLPSPQSPLATPPDAPPPPEGLRLVVPDATWRKSRKMLHLNPWLRALPRLSLAGDAVSAYTIRKAHRPGQLSTLEATCAALALLEGDAARFQPLLKAFEGFVAQQKGFVPG